MNKTCAKRRKQKIFQQASAGEKSYHERETICSSKLCLGYFSSLFEIQILVWFIWFFTELSFILGNLVKNQRLFSSELFLCLVVNLALKMLVSFLTCSIYGKRSQNVQNFLDMQFLGGL